MPKPIDISGKRFGKLTAIKYMYSEKGQRYWLFKCDCGREKNIRIVSVTAGKVKSCGCIAENRRIVKDKNNLENKKFNNLKLIQFHHKGKGGEYWTCVCDCGNTKIIKLSDVVGGKIKSCGCLSKKTNLIHGKSYCDLYHSVWTGIKQRCFNEKSRDYPRYGGRGITVCEEWKNDFMSFYYWAIKNGYKKGLSLDRINNDGNYCPENCRWATPKEQSNNTRANHIIKYKGVEKTLTEWRRFFNISESNMYSRIKKYGENSELLFKDLYNNAVIEEVCK
jgi:hypothetical protein